MNNHAQMEPQSLLSQLKSPLLKQIYNQIPDIKSQYALTMACTKTYGKLQLILRQFKIDARSKFTLITQRDKIIARHIHDLMVTTPNWHLRPEPQRTLYVNPCIMNVVLVLCNMFRYVTIVITVNPSSAITYHGAFCRAGFTSNIINPNVKAYYDPETELAKRYKFVENAINVVGYPAFEYLMNIMPKKYMTICVKYNPDTILKYNFTLVISSRMNKDNIVVRSNAKFEIKPTLKFTFPPNYYDFQQAPSLKQRTKANIDEPFDIFQSYVSHFAGKKRVLTCSHSKYYSSLCCENLRQFNKSTNGVIYIEQIDTNKSILAQVVILCADDFAKRSNVHRLRKIRTITKFNLAIDIPTLEIKVVCKSPFDTIFVRTRTLEKMRNKITRQTAYIWTSYMLELGIDIQSLKDHDLVMIFSIDWTKMTKDQKYKTVRNYWKNSILSYDQKHKLISGDYVRGATLKRSDELSAQEKQDILSLLGALQ